MTWKTSQDVVQQVGQADKNGDAEQLGKDREFKTNFVHIILCFNFSFLFEKQSKFNLVQIVNQ